MSTFWKLRLSTLAWGFLISLIFTGKFITAMGNGVGRDVESAEKYLVNLEQKLCNQCQKVSGQSK